MKKTLLGSRNQVRQRKDLGSLLRTGGHTKAQRKLACSIIGAQTVRGVQERNATEGRSG